MWKILNYVNLSIIEQWYSQSFLVKLYRIQYQTIGFRLTPQAFVLIIPRVTKTQVFLSFNLSINNYMSKKSIKNFNQNNWKFFTFFQTIKLVGGKKIFNFDLHPNKQILYLCISFFEWPSEYVFQISNCA